MSECACDKCVAACKRIPGRFMPGEAEKTAEAMGVSFDVFVRDFAIVDYKTHDEDGAEVFTYYYRPRMQGVDEGLAIASFIGGMAKKPCVFLDENDRCKIHAVKPYECREALCCAPVVESYDANNDEIDKAWCDAGNPLAVNHRHGQPTVLDAMAALLSILEMARETYKE